MTLISSHINGYEIIVRTLDAWTHVIEVKRNGEVVEKVTCKTPELHQIFRNIKKYYASDAPRE